MIAKADYNIEHCCILSWYDDYDTVNKTNPEFLWSLRGRWDDIVATYGSLLLEVFKTITSRIGGGEDILRHNWTGPALAFKVG